MISETRREYLKTWKKMNKDRTKLHFRRWYCKKHGLPMPDLPVAKNSKHGMSGTRFYRCWKSMVSRCCNPANASYERYGGRGISVCDEWRDDFIKFKQDMLDSYHEHVSVFGEKDTTLDRVNPNTDYSKENCRWATWKKQANNRANSHKRNRQILAELRSKNFTKVEEVISFLESELL